MKIFKFTILVALISLISRGIGFVREAVIANEMGVTAQADAVYLALTVTNFFQFVLGAAVANAITPKVIREKKRGISYGSDLFLNVLIKFILFLIAAVVIIYVFSSQVTHMLAPDLNPEVRNYAEWLIVISLPACFLIAISQILKDILQIEEKVIAANFGQIILNTTVIVIMFLLSGSIDAGASLMAGMIVGSLITVLIQMFTIKQLGYPLKFKSGISSKPVFITAATIMLGLFMSQIYLITNRILASSLSEGSIAALSYSERVIQLPLGIIAQSLGIVIYPILSRYIVNEDTTSTEKLLTKSLKLVIIICTPITLILIFLSEEIVTVLFARGEFGATAVDMTSNALVMFSLMLIAQSLIMLLTRMYYALDKAKIPLYSVIISVVTNIILALILREYLGHAGIALSNSISMLINAIILLLILKSYKISLNIKFNFIMIKHIAIIILTILLVYVLKNYLSLSNDFFSIVLISATISIFYAVGLFLIKDNDVNLFVKSIIKKIR